MKNVLRLIDSPLFPLQKHIFVRPPEIKESSNGTKVQKRLTLAAISISNDRETIYIKISFSASFFRILKETLREWGAPYT